jgi:nucleotide-binding universal stress UspA family protein
MRIRSILCPTDFSGNSATALELATAIAHDYSARLTIVHVKALPVTPSGVMTPEPLEPPEEAAELRRKLDAVRPNAAGVPFDHVMLIGDEATEIIGLAESEGYDLIVMGTHGRTGLSRLLMGSVAEQVVRKAPCPVLTVKAPAGRPTDKPPVGARAAVGASK